MWRLIGTGFGKPSVWDFFVKIEFDICLISSTIELFAKSEADCALRIGASTLCDCATPTENEKLLSKGVAMHAYGVSLYYV